MTLGVGPIERIVPTLTILCEYSIGYNMEGKKRKYVKYLKKDGKKKKATFGPVNRHGKDGKTRAVGTGTLSAIYEKLG